MSSADNSPLKSKANKNRIHSFDKLPKNGF